MLEQKGTLGETEGNLNEVWTLVSNNGSLIVTYINVSQQYKMLIMGNWVWGIWELSEISSQFSVNLKLF